jgi:hypothetical protein
MMSEFDGLTPPAIAHKRAIERLERITHEQRIETLKRAGILDEDGKLSSGYGGDGKPTRGEKPEPGSSAAK